MKMRPWQLLLSVPLVWAMGSDVTPIQKVLEMLGGMLAKAKDRKHAEMVEWSAYKQFCSDVELQKQTAIQRADVEKQALQADIEKHDMEVERLGKEITEHQADIEQHKKDQTKATEDREAQRKDYLETHEDYSESITAITNAIGVLKKRSADVPQAASMLQAITGFKHMPQKSKRAIDSFLSLGFDSQAMHLLSAPEANAYEFQSESILTLLQELKEKFIDERTQLEKKELIARQAYETIMLNLRNYITSAENEIGKKTRAKSDNVAGSTESSKLFDEVSASRDDDQEYLTELTTTCQKKSADFESRQKLRDEEVVALGKAIEIIKGESVTGAAEKHLPSMLQARHGASFVQFLAPAEAPASQQKAVLFLNEESQRLGSHVLSAVAMRASADPFEKVKKLISDLISKLQAQASEEEDHKNWCDDELKTNGQTRKDKSAEVETLKSTIDELESRLAVLKKDLAALSKAIAEINAAVAKATEERAKEKETNEATIAEAVEGQTAIAKAKKILSDFYQKAGEATVLTQKGSKQAPPIFDEAFQGQQTASNNVMAFLEVISSDFARLETETTKAEKDAQSDYDALMDANKKSKDEKEAEVKTKEKEQMEKAETLTIKSDDLEQAQKQLEAALDYYDKLKPSCLNTGVSFSERVQRREEEIQALKEALEILNGEGVPSGPDALYSSTQGGNLAVEYK